MKSVRVNVEIEDAAKREREPPQRIPGGYARLPNFVVDAYGAKLGVAGVAVYVVLLRHTDKDGRCWPSYDRIADLLDMNRGVVIRTIRDLESLGLVEVTRSPNRPNEYRVRSSPHEPQRGLPDEPQGSSGEPPRVRPINPRGSPREPELNPLNKTKTNPLSSNGEGGGDFEFEEFWQAYPRKEGRVRALEAWDRLRPDAATVKRIVEAIATQARSRQWQREAGRFVPTAAKWLAERRWEDEPVGTTNGTTETMADRRERIARERLERERERREAAAGRGGKRIGELIDEVLGRASKNGARNP